MNINPFNLSQATLDKLDKLSNSMMTRQIKIAESLEPTLKRHIAVLRNKADPKTPIPADTPISGRDFQYDANLLFQAEEIQQMADIISGRVATMTSSTPAAIVINIRNLLDYSQNTPSFNTALNPAYRDLILEDQELRGELEAKYTEIKGPEKKPFLSGLLGGGPKKPGDKRPGSPRDPRGS